MCKPNPCKHGGTCTSLKRTIWTKSKGFHGAFVPTCSCTEGFIGDYCERGNNKIEYVISLLLVDSFISEIVHSWYSPFYCFLERCFYCNCWTCLNGGTCFENDRNPVCECPSGYSGSHCHFTGKYIPLANFRKLNPLMVELLPSKFCNSNIVLEIDKCKDTNEGSEDILGTECPYEKSYCGIFDDNDFNSNEMCCSCGGGRQGIIFYHWSNLS